MCCEVANEKKDIIFEIGTEEQSGGTNTLEEFEYVLNEIFKYCKKIKFKIKFYCCANRDKSYGNAQYWSFNSPFDNKRTSC